MMITLTVTMFYLCMNNDSKYSQVKWYMLHTYGVSLVGVQVDAMVGVQVHNDEVMRPVPRTGDTSIPSVPLLQS